MATIELYNQYSKVIDASPKAKVAIDVALAVETPRHEFSPSFKAGFWDGMTRFYKADKFPTGLLSNVVRALTRSGEYFEIHDKRNTVGYTLPSEVTLLHKDLGSITLRDYQYESVQKALEASRGVINVATNGGKTEIACGIIQSVLPHLKKDEKLVFFTHAKEIFTQSAKRISERLGIKVGLIGQGKWEEEQVTVVMIPTLQKYLKKPKDIPNSKKLKDMTALVSKYQLALRTKDISEENKQKYSELLEEAQKELTSYRKSQRKEINEKVVRTQNFLSKVVGFLADEVHHASSDTWYKVFMELENAYYRFGLTGTVNENEPISHMKLLGCTGRIVIKVSNDFLIEQGHSAKPTIYMMSIPAKPLDVSYMYARSEGIINNTVRNNVFINKIQERADSGKQCLIIVNETEHGDIIEGMLKDCGHTVRFTHGQKPDKFREETLKELANGKLRILIATTILDEGVDVSGINCLFLMAGGKSMRQVLQRIGRGLRKKADGSGLEVYDALDYHNEYLVAHTMERYNTYKKEKFDIVKL